LVAIASIGSSGVISPLVHETLEASEALCARKGSRGSRTRSLLRERQAALGQEAGAVACLERAISDENKNGAFRELAKSGAKHLLFERIVLDYPESFSDAALPNARARQAGLD
jgi:hypothetical protein